MPLVSQSNVSEDKRTANQTNARKSTGPRTPAGKRQSARNAYKHGFYAQLFGETMKVLREDEEGFGELLEGLRESIAPRNLLEDLLVGDLAKLWWKKGRVERAQAAYQAQAMEDFEQERLHRLHVLNRETIEETTEETRQQGLRRGPQTGAKYREELAILDALLQAVERRDWRQDLGPAIAALYGEDEQMTWTGRALLGHYRDLQRADERSGVAPIETPPGEKDEDTAVWNAWIDRLDAQADPNWDLFMELRQVLLEEQRDVLEEYRNLMARETRVTPAMVVSRLAPLETGPWTLMLRQEAALERQLDRKLRLLLKLREEGPRLGVGDRPGPREDGRETMGRVEAGGAESPGAGETPIDRGRLPARLSKIEERSQEVVENKGSGKNGSRKSEAGKKGKRSARSIVESGQQAPRTKGDGEL